MNIAMIGAGYVGLVTGTCFADFGFSVTCIDKAEEKIDALRHGRIPIYEPGLRDLVAKNTAAGRLTFTTSLAETVADADVVFIAVGTPSRRGDGHADLEYVYAAAAEIARSITGYTVIVVKSTVPVGTGDEVERIIGETVPGERFSVVSNPEFLREGAAIEDFKRPDRVVVGTPDPRAREVMAQLYRPLSLNQSPILFTDRRTAELTKYAANAFLATKITFINEMADICEAAGANVQDVARGIGLDRRIGPKFLHAGPGYGGSCFPKDTLALVKTAQDFGAPSRIVETVVGVNDQRKRAMARKVVAACGGSVRGATVAVLGLTFKPNTDDMREAPSIAIVRALQDAGAKVRAFDPIGMANAPEVMDHVEYAEDAYRCLDGADAMVLVTEWDMLRGLDPKTIRKHLKGDVVVDLRNVYNPEEMRAHGLTYVGVGR
ncbi:MAG TPA: UDP-glucose/GDP-mannose dehydrogenase family protein [Pararhizobium sp.]|nr:UDP-glucose/GDP-mannose dehydrogenase family protein [Pararhizobium sp.]